MVGLLRDGGIHYADRLELWSNFNLCWLAVCQKQKDLLQVLIASGQQSSHVSLIQRDRMEAMGNDLIQLCDQLEQHGLVDYQLGIWEEEILSGKSGTSCMLSIVLLTRSTNSPESMPRFDGRQSRAPS